MGRKKKPEMPEVATETVELKAITWDEYKNNAPPVFVGQVIKPKPVYQPSWSTWSKAAQHAIKLAVVRVA